MFFKLPSGLDVWRADSGGPSENSLTREPLPRFDNDHLKGELHFRLFEKPCIFLWKSAPSPVLAEGRLAPKANKTTHQKHTQLSGSRDPPAPGKVQDSQVSLWKHKKRTILETFLFWKRSVCSVFFLNTYAKDQKMKSLGHWSWTLRFAGFPRTKLFKYFGAPAFFISTAFISFFTKRWY